MSNDLAPSVVEGGCHCGAVRYRVTLRACEAVECNCSICTKKGFLHLIVPESDFELLCGGDALTTYTFGTHTAKHHFCRHCGIHSYYRPRSHPDRVDVNVRCLDGVEPSDFQLSSFDGQHWEESVGELRDRPRKRQ
ncbi:MAG: GFA family protein [Polyangiales bacterium]